MRLLFRNMLGPFSLRVCLAATILFLYACGGSQHKPSSSSGTSSGTPSANNIPPPSSSRYTVDKDYYPDKKMDPSTIEDAVPRVEEIKRAGNPNPYEVFGVRYQLIDDPSGYKEKGGASWYGLKFHGHKTANGEVYSIYEMTAAHKTLPIPCYVKVTNLANGRSAIVRVNDRGPFHEGRIIDLSYAAATKLGYAGQGVAQVEVEYIDAATWKSDPKPVVNDAVYLQVGAYSDEAVATEMFDNLYQRFSFPVKLNKGDDKFYRIRIGPIPEEEVSGISVLMEAEGFPVPFRVKGDS